MMSFLLLGACGALPKNKKLTKSKKDKAFIVSTRVVTSVTVFQAVVLAWWFKMKEKGEDDHALALGLLYYDNVSSFPVFTVYFFFK